jgi:hypothetical protein
VYERELSEERELSMLDMSLIRDYTTSTYIRRVS